MYSLLLNIDFAIPSSIAWGKSIAGEKLPSATWRGKSEHGSGKSALKESVNWEINMILSGGECDKQQKHF